MNGLLVVTEIVFYLKRMRKDTNMFKLSGCLQECDDKNLCIHYDTFEFDE